MKENEGLDGLRRHAVSCNLASPAPHLTASEFDRAGSASHEDYALTKVNPKI